MNENIIKGIKSLPPLSKTIMDIQQLDSESSVADLIKIVEKDPMIVADLLKAANSPLYNFSKEITSIAQVVSLFGLNITRSIILGQAMKKLMSVDLEPYGIDELEFSHLSLVQANLAYALAKRIIPHNQDLIFLAALLQESGKILLAKELKEIAKVEEFQKSIKTSANISIQEKEILGTTTAQVTARIFHYWKLDTKLIKIIQYSDSPSKASDEIKKEAAILQFVRLIVNVVNPFHEDIIEVVLNKAEKFGYSREIFKEEIEKSKLFYEKSKES